MTTTIEKMRPSHFRFGHVVVDTVRLLGQRLPTIVLLALLMRWLPLLVFNRALSAIPSALAMRQWTPPGATVIDQVASECVAVAVAFSVLSEVEGFSANLLAAARRTVRAAPQVIPLAVLLGAPDIILVFGRSWTLNAGALTKAIVRFVEAFGALGVLVYLWVAIGVVAPVIAIERRSLIQSISRAASLMRGRRWSFFGLFALYLVLGGSIAFVGQSLVARLVIANPLVRLAEPTRLLGSLLGVVWAVAVAAAYREMVRIKDGWKPGEIADIFD
jgi:hypothetical protein